MKYVFKEKSVETEEYLPPKEGSVTFSSCAKVTYKFDADNTVKLGINNYWFSLASVDELIDFLLAVKKEIKE